ncbi:MAG: response regulator [Proteobacteria bacterium]|nr:response regulator [Pseudomonadota bacterium]
MTTKNILVVDDERDVVEFLRDLLEDNGYSVEVAYDGVGAMEQVLRQRPDLILLDLQMPEETGTGFYRKLHNKRELKDIPIIIVSGLAGRNLAVTKSVTVIDKPPEEIEILEEVRKALGNG